MAKCDFLPAPMEFDGNWAHWAEFIERLHKQFEKDLVHNVVKVADKRVIIDFREDPELGKQEAFWHVVTRTYAGGRNAELIRAERINWIRPILENHEHGCITHFRYQHKPRVVRHYFWLREEQFVVILQEVPSGLKLITSFFIDARGKNEDLESRYKNRILD